MIFFMNGLGFKEYCYVVIYFEKIIYFGKKKNLKLGKFWIRLMYLKYFKFCCNIFEKFMDV